jgi:serine/threonine-protein kinase RsbW
VPDTVRELRHRAAQCATAMGAPDEMHHAVTLAVSEVVTNAVVHAYAGRDPGQVSMRCRVDSDQLVVEVLDEGVGVAERPESPGIGQGLALVGAVARSLEVTSRADGPGTIVTMAFGAAAPVSDGYGLEPLCALALERLADVSNLDVVIGGVLRRVAAEVAGDPALTAWLRATAPRAKPGTATWKALREGGAQLVVHDPSVPRSPGGTGEQLGLMWWISVPLARADGTPAALWGLGGREGGRPVPAERVIRALAAAARTDLSRESERDALRAQLSEL